MDKRIIIVALVTCIHNGLISTNLAVSAKQTFDDNRVWVPVPQKDFITRQFSKESYCIGIICDRMVRHAQELSRLKLIRRYVRDTVATLDRLVTALDAELIAAGGNLQKSLGDSCRAANAVLDDVTEDGYEFEGFK